MQRRLEVYYLARYFNFGFRMLPVTNFDSNYGDGLNSDRDKLNEINLISSFFPFLNESCTHQSHCNLNFISKIFSKLKWLHLTKMLKICKYISFLVPYHFLIRVPMPSKIDLNRTELYRNLSLAKSEPQIPIKITIHLPWARTSLLPDRAVPLKWYLQTLSSICRFLKDNDFDYSISLHTDAGLNLDNNKIQSWVSKETEHYWNNSNLGDFTKNTGYAHLDVESIFSDYSNIEIFQNITPTQVWAQFKNSDILILSNSSLSLVGAIYCLDYCVGFAPGNKETHPMPRFLSLDVDSPNEFIIYKHLSEYFLYKNDF